TAWRDLVAWISRVDAGPLVVSSDADVAWASRRQHAVEDVDRKCQRLAAVLGGQDSTVTAGFETHREGEPIVVVVVDDQKNRIQHPPAPRMCSVAGLASSRHTTRTL